MKFVALFGTLPLLAAAAPTQRDSGSFTAFSDSGYPKVAHKPLQASGQKFWLGGEPGTYCPTIVNPNCPPGKVTAFAGPYALSVEVPGGQQIYVDPKGALSFTQAHSASIPPGSSLGPFEYTAEGRPFGEYTFTGWGADGFMACPDNDGDPKTWQVFANIDNATVPTGDIDDCFPFKANTLPFDQNPAAWQYT